MAKKKNVPDLTFDEQLILFRYFLHELGIEGLSTLSRKLNSTEYEGVDESGRTYFSLYIEQYAKTRGIEMNFDKLRVYDENICRHTKQISERRGTLRWKYFQYVSLLFTEMYLDRYFGDREAFCADLNIYLDSLISESLGRISFEHYSIDKLNKLAYMCATGSGKTLIMHVNILQFGYYFRRARRANSRLSINKIIVLAPNEGMSKQHLEELTLSSIPAAIFDKNWSFSSRQDEVIVIDMNKLKEEGKVKTVSVDSFEQNNLVLVDEGHRGLSGDIWYDYRTRLSADGFSFEYSATFKQALKASSTKKEDKALMEEYGKSIIMDYSYKYFYEDGYGKDYRIYNLRDSIDEEQRHLYLTGGLLSFYQQLKLYSESGPKLRDFNIEKPLMVFVGNRVTTSTSKGELTDIEEVLDFLDKFVRNKTVSIGRINDVFVHDTGLRDASGNDLFYGSFSALEHIYGGTLDATTVFEDILRLVFNSDTVADEPRLQLRNIKQVPGEIGMRIGSEGEYFGVINIGDTAELMKRLSLRDIDTDNEEFISESMFRSINNKDSSMNILIGSRKFTEGWNSWRVSTMGLINFAKGEGSQAIQLFGRGVRLKGYQRCLKRSRRLNDRRVTIPQDIEVLETLTIFGVKAQYMEDFKRYLELEGAPVNDNLLEYKMPVISRYNEAKDKKLHVIRVRDGANFKRQSRRMVLDVPDEGFKRYLSRSKTRIDCRSKIQTIDSTFSFKLESSPEEHTLPKDKLRYLDYQRIFEELEQYKNEKFYYNISIDKNKLKDIIMEDFWYSLLIPKSHLNINSVEKLIAANDYAVLALKSYLDKFFKYEKERWEAPRLEYKLLEESDNNFVDEYKITYAPLGEWDHTGEELEKLVLDISTILTEHNGLDVYQKPDFHDRLVLFDFRVHLYAPLICLQKSNLKIQVTPVSLNEDEKKFVDLLHDYVTGNPEILRDKTLYLLRNKSKTGMGFFEAGNFYPDFILWINSNDTEYISFIDPKGLLNLNPDDPKIQFYKIIKEKEEQLSSQAVDKHIVLNSFIMSGTNEMALNERWRRPDIPDQKAFREERNIYMLDDENCIAKMMGKIVV